jgi:hypothetical protein
MAAAGVIDKATVPLGMEMRMGFVKDMKTNTAGKDAARAVAEGRQVFVFKFDMPNLNSAATASVSGAAETIEAIEAEGWVLGHMSVHPSVRHGAMVMVFRRR